MTSAADGAAGSSTATATDAQPVASAWREFLAGASMGAPAAISVVPIGLLYGALATQKGLSPLEIALACALIFAGSAQFVALELWTTPASWVVLGFAALTINLRHIMMGASLGRRLRRFSLLQKLTGMWQLSDESWAMAERRARLAPLTPACFWGVSLVIYLSWLLFSVAGAMLGALMDDPARYGFDFAFAALFTGLIVGFWRGSRTGAVIAASAVAALAVKSVAGGAWFVVAGGLAGMLVAAALPAEGTADAD